MFDIHDAINKLGETKQFLVHCRSDNGFEKTLVVDARELAEELQTPAPFETVPMRVRRTKKQSIYEARDKPVQSTKHKFKVNFYLVTLTHQHSCIKLVQHLASSVKFIHCRIEPQSKLWSSSLLDIRASFVHGGTNDYSCFWFVQ